MVLDSYFPAESEVVPDFARPNDERVGTWQMFVEKAYAKLYNGYANLDLGHASVAFRELTGAPAEYIDLHDQSDAWGALEKALSKGYLITASSKSQNLIKQDALVRPMHCYSLLDIAVISYKNHPKRFVLLKNPTGDSANGNGKSYPKEIETQLQQRLISKKIEDEEGLFWYAFEDLKTNFEVLQSCLLHDEYCNSSLEVKNPNGSKSKQFLFKAQAPKGTHGYITVNRKNIKHWTNDKQVVKNFKYGVQRIVVFEISEDSQIKILGNSFSAMQTATAEINVNQPEFYIYVDNDYNTSLDYNFDCIISTYAEKPIHLINLEEQTQIIRNDKSKKLLKGLLLSFARSTKKPLLVQEFKSKKGDGVCQSWYGEMLGYVAFVYCNNSKNETFSVEYIPSDMKNVGFYHPFVNKNGNSLKVGPMEVDTVMLKFGWENNCSHVCNLKTKTLLN